MARQLFVWVHAAALFGVAAAPGGCGARASTLTLESATPAAVGRWDGVSITTKQFVGWRFWIGTTLDVTHIGGHLFGIEQDIFGALVSLSSIDAFPRGVPSDPNEPFDPNEVVAAVTFSAPQPSDEILVPLSATLAPGSYALVYGSGEFGATGGGALPNFGGHEDIPPTSIASYIFWGIPRPNATPEWRTNLGSKMRFVVRGDATFTRGDMNGDGSVDTGDIDGFVLGLNDPYAYRALYSLPPEAKGDMDDDNDLDFDDVDGFVALLSATMLVPEPPAWWLAIAGVLALVLFGRQRVGIYQCHVASRTRTGAKESW